MELTKLKLLNNTGELTGKYKTSAEKLPCFADGFLAHQLGGAATLNNQQSAAASSGQNSWTMHQLGGAQTMGEQTKEASSNVGGNKKNLFDNGGAVSSLSSLAGAHPYAAAAAYVLQGINEGMSRLQGTDTLIDDAGTSQGNVGGISYTKQNIVNAGEVMGDYDKSMTDSLWSNPFTTLTQWGLRGKQKKYAELAQIKTTNTQNDQRAGALTKSMRLSNAKTYGDPQSQYLYGAKNGKLPCFEDGVVSAFGKIDAPVTAKVSNGEVMMQDGVMSRVGKGKDSKDTLPAYADGSTTIYPNKGKDRFGMDISDYVWKTGDTDGGLYMLQQYQADKAANQFYAKNGKLPKFAEGGWGNAIISGIGALQGLDQYLMARRNTPYRPNTYVDNPYEIDALSTLAGLRMNPYPIMQQLRSAETRTNRAIDRSGGLSAGQRSLGRISALYGTQQNIANTLTNMQLQNNQYKANYAQAALNAGQNNRTARMQSNQWDLDYYSKAHAAQLGGMQMGARNMLQQLQSWQQNDFKRRQFNDTMALYRDDQARNWAELDMLSRQNNLFNTKDDYLSYGKKMGWIS